MARELLYHPRRDVTRRPSGAFAWVEPITSIYPREIKNFNVKKILDIGAGHGDFVIYACNRGLDAHAMDLRKDIYEGPKNTFHHADVMERFPFDDESFDLVFENRLVSDLLDLQKYDYNKVLSHLNVEIARVLRPKGFFHSALDHFDFSNFNFLFDYEGRMQAMYQKK